uniref:hypothetical protein n=1 Tax=Wolbachia endosymbiont of Pentidionis agamae TaxID=3110435 RepID=UPI002FD697EC
MVSYRDIKIFLVDSILEGGDKVDLLENPEALENIEKHFEAAQFIISSSLKSHDKCELIRSKAALSNIEKYPERSRSIMNDSSVSGLYRRRVITKGDIFKETSVTLKRTQSVRDVEMKSCGTSKISE